MHYSSIDHGFTASGQILVVFTQTTKMPKPGEGLLHHPVLRLQPESLLVIRTLDHFEGSTIMVLDFAQEIFAPKGAVYTNQLQPRPN